MADKLPFFAAESGIWRTTAPNPHIDLSGTALTLGTYPAQTFKAAADDTTLDFASTNTCTVVVWVDANNWKRYEGAVWTDAATDTLDLSAATLMGAAGTISADAAVSVVASLPSIVADSSIAFIDVTTGNASTTAHGFAPKAVAPAVGVLNVYGITNGETAIANKTIFDGLLKVVILTRAAYNALGPGRPAATLYVCNG